MDEAKKQDLIMDYKTLLLGGFHQKADSMPDR
jgi:hypothetical protein